MPALLLRKQLEVEAGVVETLIAVVRLEDAEALLVSSLSSLKQVCFGAEIGNLEVVLGVRQAAAENHFAENVFHCLLLVFGLTKQTARKTGCPAQCRTPCLLPDALAADDQGFDEADPGELGRNHAVATVFDVVAAAETGAEHDANHLALAFVASDHALDLMAILAHDALHGTLRNENFVKRHAVDFALAALEVAVVVIEVVVAVVLATVVLVAHRDSLSGKPLLGSARMERSAMADSLPVGFL